MKVLIRATSKDFSGDLPKYFVKPLKKYNLQPIKSNGIEKYSIEIKTPEDLWKLGDLLDEELIITKSDDLKHLALEIYDDYRE